MKFRKSVSLVLIASQVSLGTLAWADTTTPQVSAPSPEFTLLENVIALQGENVPGAIAQSQLSSDVTTYLATAPQAGNQQRLKQALVDLGVYTPEQAQTFVVDAQNAAVKAESNAAQVNPAQAMTAEISQLAALHPAGAQFSACDLVGDSGLLGGIVTGVGAVTLIVGLALRFDNPTCSAPFYAGTTCGPDGCYATTLEGPTTCTDPGYYPHAQSGDDTMIAGGIVTGVGALLLLLSQTVCGD